MEEVKEDITTDNKKTESKGTEDRTEHRKRIHTLKKVIVGILLSLLLLPTILSVVALGQIHQLNMQLNQSLLILSDLSMQVQEVRRIAEENNSQDVAIDTNASQPASRLQQIRMEDVVPADPYEGMVKVCLTFDDGPSRNTDAILDILDSYGIKATFFVNGHPGFEDQYRRIVEEGHTIGMHSYSHVYSDVYADIDGFATDLEEIRSYIRELTGEESIYYRFPGGSSNTVHTMPMQECIDYLDEMGITYFDWNVSIGDALGYERSVNALVDTTMAQINALDAQTIVILMHDAPGKETTVEALPILIEKIQALDNVAIVPITEDVTPVHHVIQ
ncbi:MAG: polysaccharide deacetylase [Lachnospiraceae bacterium]|nr:polysaccharide deacetylase [Lachnospiraceae bacterium]